MKRNENREMRNRRIKQLLLRVPQKPHFSPGAKYSPQQENNHHSSQQFNRYTGNSRNRAPFLRECHSNSLSLPFAYVGRGLSTSESELSLANSSMMVKRPSVDANSFGTDFLGSCNISWIDDVLLRSLN